jgi:predicted TIM-barrel fold metal-dependent hydrolase
VEDFERLAAAFPQTIFVLAHWGGGLANARTLARLPNVHFDTAASPLLYEGAVVRACLAELPAARILYGSDYPLVLYPQRTAAPEFGGFLAELRDAGASATVLGENAARLVGA